MLHFLIIAPLLIAILAPFLYKKLKSVHTGWFVLVVPLFIFIYLLSLIRTVIHKPLLLQLNWMPSLGINYDLYVDGLSILFGLLISGIGTLVVFYSIYYLHKTEKLGHFYVYLLMFMSAMLGVVFSDNIFVFYMFWEFTSLSSFLLIGFWNHRHKSRYGAQKSMLITVFGGLSMLAGLIWMSLEVGSSSIRVLIQNSEIITNSPYFMPMLLLVLLGAFTKSAQFPFHTWLPDAMEAPTPVSAYLHSATMVKAGIYLVARLSLLFAGTDEFFLIVSGFGLLTLCWGSYMAVKQTDLKGILAYSTISQLGMIMAMLGFGTGIAVFAAIFHILNHATFKGSLFMVAGIVDHETGTRDIRRLGGLYTLMPITATLAIFGVFSMAGIPLPIMNGFLSKEMFFDAAVDLRLESGSIYQMVAPFFPIIAVIGSIFTFVYSMILFFKTFTGKLQLSKLERKPHDPPIGMLISPAVLVVLIVVIALFPGPFNKYLLTPAVTAVMGEVPHTKIYFWHGFYNAPLFMSLIVLFTGTLLYLTRDKWLHVYNRLPGRWSMNKTYDYVVNGIFKGSTVLTNSYMTGSLRSYFRIIVGFIAIIGLYTMYSSNGFALNINSTPFSLPEFLVALTMAVAAISIIFVHNRIAAILILGVVGYGLSLLFVFYSAPDLALTQLIVETVTVGLFLLCFYHLPELKRDKETSGNKLFNLVVSVGFGVLITLIGISSHSSKWFKPISDYFLENSYELGGGNNVVNVILVDMRGLDTMLEICVLGIAALGILAMIKYNRKGDLE
ncbi:multicomponent Na+:H+ antiporter subunit A [Bacillus mesophilus]|uniref:Na+/H+ antiporter subunit A n=1 Tax=Bacillus mesophilus TaxID=1808955 RepID=A0A6M0Q7H1_9BACI|nr:Na+/H+ antiporter subunit A [Bacillus mesophilus]MBM7660754.1 multicomponent Na+:H+ antiporter subunit A [Bacillus mesophilus]NEY71699.1 Na+/H+ antiporter subunit A [Bacillus mesophilus]